MPYQLRRIVAINIKNSITRLPSGRVAELDPRGGVLAIGENGVGKTTFLRLLPVFYGATTSQILRGSGRDSLIGYLLPDPSSCVVYEYERETETDLRCVVMHCQSNADAPEFRIIHAGFREDFFYDENNQFVLRDEYPRRVEEMGYEVTRKLMLNQYRSVILNERLSTKESAELRRLAAVHSLSPKPLTNLEQIAAAMANEKINFRDLQNIVIERVSDSQGDVANPAQSRRELKKSRNDVSQWLEAHDHMVAVSKAAPDAQKLKVKADRVKGIHLELSALKLAVNAAISQVEQEHVELVKLKAQREEEVAAQADGIEDAIAQLDLSIPPLESAVAVASSRVTTAESRIEYFTKINVESLAEQEASEASHKSKMVSKQAELAELNKAGGDVATRKIARNQEIETGHTNELGRISTARQSEVEQLSTLSKNLETQQINDEESLQKPARLVQIPVEINGLNVQVGELGATIKHPVASSQSVANLSAARTEVGRIRSEHGAAGKELLAAQAAERTCQFESNQATDRLTSHGQKIQIIDAEIENLNAKLDPAPGSLLAFFRGVDPQLWSDTAKVIDPALLSRQDLAPHTVVTDSGAAPQAERSDVGGISLRVSELDVPSWVDMKDLREQISKAQAGRIDAMRLQTEAQDNAKKAAKALVAAKTRREQAEATLALADAAMGNTEANVTRAENVVLQEELACKADAERQLAIVRKKLDDLTEERRILEEEAATRLSILRAEFTAQKDRLRDEYNDAVLRLDGEQREAELRRKEQQLALEADISRELAGLGIDPQRVAALESEISDLGDLLNSIASNRHEVALWRKFRLDTEPSLPTWRREAKEAKERLDTEKSARQLHVKALTNLQNDARHEFQRMDTGIQKRELELTSLKSLRDGSLAMFDAYVPSKLHVDWSVETLKEKIEGLRESLRLEALDLQTKSRALRNLMLSKAGGVQQWVELREKELPDEQTLHEHEWFCEKARVLIDWFQPMECGPYIDQLNKEMVGFMDLASTFVGDLDLFDRRIQTFNSQLQKALSDTAKFERFRDLSVIVRSGVNQIEYLKVLRKMRDVSLSRHSSWRTHSIQERELPTVDDVMLVRQFKDILPVDGRVQVNLSEHVRLECSLVENGQARRITNQEEFQAVSSNGNTALITAMFLMGFVQMIRGTDSGVRLTWVTDEVGRFDAGNLASFMRTLNDHQIDVISASPSVDPALARQFSRLSYFENTGAIATTRINAEEDFYVEN